MNTKKKYAMIPVTGIHQKARQVDRFGPGEAPSPKDLNVEVLALPSNCRRARPEPVRGQPNKTSLPKCKLSMLRLPRHRFGRYWKIRGPD
jgi:hypothetical protein